MKKYVLIVAGGLGLRINAGTPKQFIVAGGKPLLMHTIQNFFEYDSKTEIIVVLPENQIETWKNLCSQHSFGIKHRICPGGERRFDSVSNGLTEIKGNGIVFIHDGVRPFVSHDTLSRCFETASNHGNAIPVYPVTESLRKLDFGKNISVDRSKYYTVQTPQTFKVSLIKKAYNQEYSPLFTDDASVLESIGKSINLVDGNPENIKITYPHDLLFSEILLQKQLQSPG
jgi:2-C-methyl-D-erythritol 4-phosphate cytidylyltransferase